jgi:hypothetical protein
MIRLFAFAAFAVAMAGAQERPKEWEAFAHRARGLPPEYGADLLLRLATIDKAKSGELIAEAFWLAARAPDAYPTMGGLHTDTRAYVTASRHGLDVLSLRMRAVQAVLPMDPARAAAMFLESPIAALPVLTCKAVHVPQIEDYYRTLALVYEKGFSAKQRERDEPRHMLEAAIAALRSPMQVEPLGLVLLQVVKPPRDRQELLDAFGAALGRVTPSDRAFSRHERSLLGLARQTGVNPTALLQGLGAYIATHLSGPRCTRSFRAPTEIGVEFNRLAAEINAGGNAVPLIPVERMKAERDAGAWNDVDFWTSARGKAVMEDLRWLNHGNRDLPGDKRFWTAEERKSLEWSARYQELQKRIEGWQESEETAAVDAFWMQSHTYALAAELVPEPAAQALAVRRWLTHLEQGYQPGEAQNAWFGALQWMLPANPSYNKTVDRAMALQEMRASRNPVIAAYAEWEMLAPKK